MYTSGVRRRPPCLAGFAFDASTAQSFTCLCTRMYVVVRSVKWSCTMTVLAEEQQLCLTLCLHVCVVMIYARKQEVQAVGDWTVQQVLYCGPLSSALSPLSVQSSMAGAQQQQLQPATQKTTEAAPSQTGWTGEYKHACIATAVLLCAQQRVSACICKDGPM